MADYTRVKKNKNDDTEKKQRTKQQDSQYPVGQSHESDNASFLLTETPFSPKMDEHASTLSGIPYSVQRHEFVMQLQRTYGNRYVQSLMKTIDVQAKLRISESGDIYEQEADRVADMVTGTINTQIQSQPEEEEEEELQTKSILQLQDEEEELQMQSDDRKLFMATDDLETSINNKRGNGQSLSDNVKIPMEHAFGTDFSGVRVHTDKEADVLNQQLNARAFTTGKDVFFRNGEYSPGSENGRKLIAHELTHVVQQNNKPANRSNIKTQIQRWTWDGIKDQIPPTTQGKLQGYKIVKMDTLPWTEQLWKIRWWRKSNLLIGTKNHTSKGYHSNKLGEVGLSRELDDNDALATLVHEATHAGQHKQKAINPAAFGSLIDREIEAHIEEERYRIANGMQSKTYGIAELADHQIERNKDGSINEKSVEDFVRWRYANHVPKDHRRIRQPIPEGENFQNKEVIFTYIK